MNWISNWKKIGIKVRQIFTKQPTGKEQTDWKNCNRCNKISYLSDLISNSYICECGFHFDLPPKLRLENLFDTTYEIIEAPKDVNPDPLFFEVKGGARESYKYINKVKKYQNLTGQHSALLCAHGNISNLNAVVVCFNPKFGGGRLGITENEHFLKAANFAVNKKNKVDIWIVIYQSSGIDVHTGATGLAGMTKSVIAMSEIKKAGIPTFAVAARATAGGTLASSYYLHDFIIVESKCVENILFSGRRVTENILKSTDSIPENYGRGDGIFKAGLADILLENRKELKENITRLANIILKKEESKISNEEEIKNRESDIKVSSAS